MRNEFYSDFVDDENVSILTTCFRTWLTQFRIIKMITFNSLNLSTLSLSLSLSLSLFSLSRSLVLSPTLLWILLARESIKFNKLSIRNQIGTNLNWIKHEMQVTVRGQVYVSEHKFCWRERQLFMNCLYSVFQFITKGDEINGG